jgi:hypothetical protein
VATATTPVESYRTAVMKCYQTLVNTRCWHGVHERSGELGIDQILERGDRTVQRH